MKLERKLIRKLRLVLLVLGVIVSWFATLSAFKEFYGYEGTIFKIRNCVIPNPITTPCFWGALAFVGALIWAYKKYGKETVKFEKNFLYFMIFSVIFAWSNFTVELKGVQPKPGALISPCKSSANPFTSPCFFGSILFTLTLIVTFILVKKYNKNKKK